MMRKKLSTFAMITVVLCFTIGSIGGCYVGGGGMEQRDCVAIIGDSIFALTGQINRHLQEVSGQKYRTYYVSGTQMQGGIYPNIQVQAEMAFRQGQIRTLIMDGGGNDFFFDSLLQANLTPAKMQQVINQIRNAYANILDNAQKENVQNIVVMGYYKTITTPTAPELQPAGMAEELIAAAAERGIKLVYVDPQQDPWFYNRSPWSYTIDTIHPTTAAANKLAELIWDAMQANGIEPRDCPCGSDCGSGIPSGGSSSGGTSSSGGSVW